MTPLSIPSATEIYSDASACEISRHWVDHTGLSELSRSLRMLVQSLGDEVADEFWRRTLGPLRRTAFALCSTPLPFIQIAASLGTEWNQVHRNLWQCQQMYPDHYELLKRIVSGLEGLLSETSSPFVGPLELLHQQYGALSVVLRDRRMNRPVADFFAGSPSLRHAKVVSASQLRGAHQCDVLVAIGPCGWFPEYVFSAPRAFAVHVISYRWIRDGWKPGPLFLHNTDKNDGRRSSHCIGQMPRVSGETRESGSRLDDLNPPDLLPPLPVFGIQGAAASGASLADSSIELVPARLCHLSGGRGVLVPADEGASSLVIDASEVGRAAVRRLPTDELEQGLYLLLRTSGGGDFIAPLADRLMGDSAAERRVQQAKWKEQLSRTAIERFGAISRWELSSAVCADLLSQGLSGIRPANVHYWMSSKCIRPRKADDFAAILKFAGLEVQTQDLWLAMGDIDRAHRRAGHRIRRMLLERIASMSLEHMERDGEMDFELGDQGGGSLSAYQITTIIPQEFEVPASKIGVLLDTED